jgi:hypothetical protein
VSAKQQQIAILQIGADFLQIEPALTLAEIIHDFNLPSVCGRDSVSDRNFFVGQTPC